MVKIVRICCIGWASLFAGLVSSVAWAQSKPQTPLPSQSTSIKSSNMPGNLCSASERTVFSCMLKRNKKSVSLCASSDLSRFYYIYGRPGAPELIFPPKNQSIKNPFSHSTIFHAGDTGGEAYSFINEGFEYIIYSWSGRYDYRDAGVIIQRSPGSLFAIQDLSCQKSSIYEPDDADITNTLIKWPADPNIEQNGLPTVNR